MVTGEIPTSTLDAYDRAHGIKSQPTKKGGLIAPTTPKSKEITHTSGPGVRTSLEDPKKD